MYYSTMNTCTRYILGTDEERLKAELATMCGSLNHNALFLLCQVYQLTSCFTCRILTKHSDDKSSVEAVRKHGYAEQLYSDQHQDKVHFRWIQRNLNVDGASMEKLKEIEANKSEDKAKTISADTTVKNVSSN